MYTEHFDHLLNLLDLSAQSGILSLAPTEEAEASPWQAIGVLVDGKVTACKVTRTSDESVIVSGLEALGWLKAQRGMYWELEQTRTPSTDKGQERKQRPGAATSLVALGTTQREMPKSFSPVPGAKPRRTQLGQQQPIPHAWSRLQRQVFALVDGKRDSAEIARLLSNKPLRDIEHILQTLRATGFIE